MYVRRRPRSLSQVAAPVLYELPLSSPSEPFKQIKALTKSREAPGMWKHRNYPPSGFPHKKTNRLAAERGPLWDVSIQSQSVVEAPVVLFFILSFHNILCFKLDVL